MNCRYRAPVPFTPLGATDTLGLLRGVTPESLAPGFGRLRDFAVAAAARARGRRRPGYVRGATFEKVMFPSLPNSPFSTLSHSPSAPPYVGTCAQAMCEDRIIVCPDVATDTRFDAGWRRLYLGCGLHSVQSAPVFGCNGKALGTFVMALKEPGASFDREVTGFGVYAMRTILQNYDHPGLRRA